MLKKITPLILKIIPAVSLLLGALAAPGASAWDEVCVNFTGGLIDEGRLYVVHGFPVEEGDRRFPTSYYDEGGILRHIPAWVHPEGYARRIDPSRAAAGRIRSGYGPAGSTKCASIRNLPSGEPFFVYVEYMATRAEGRDHFWHARCSTHSSNPDLWYYQQNRPYGRIMFQSTTTTEAECAYWRETN